MNPRSTLTYSPGAFGPVLADLGGSKFGWMDFAACAEVDTEIFFPTKGGTTRFAKSVCADCPVADECLRSQMAWERSHRGYEPHGVFGGKSALERREMHAAQTELETAA